MMVGCKHEKVQTEHGSYARSICPPQNHCFVEARGKRAKRFPFAFCYCDRLPNEAKQALYAFVKTNKQIAQYPTPYDDYIVANDEGKEAIKSLLEGLGITVFEGLEAYNQYETKLRLEALRERYPGLTDEQIAEEESYRFAEMMVRAMMGEEAYKAMLEAEEE